MKAFNKVINSIFCLLVVAIGFCIPLSLQAQTQIEQSVISSGGNESSSTSIQLSSTVGEPAVQTVNTTNFIFTQGFQQPISGILNNTMQIFLSSTSASCRGENNGMAMIDSISGCLAPYEVIWNSLPTPFDTVPIDTMQIGPSMQPVELAGLSPSLYTVQVTSADGCTNIFPFSIGLITTEDCLLKFYTGITPNGDGYNDSWIIDNIDSLYPVNSVNIFNRLGRKVWEGKDYNNTTVVWSGENLNDKELPSATYFFIFEADGLTEKGWIELTR